MSTRSKELLKRLFDHEFREGDSDSCGTCENCHKEVQGSDGLYKPTSYEYDETQCLCEPCCIKQMDDDEAFWASIPDTDEGTP